MERDVLLSSLARGGEIGSRGGNALRLPLSLKDVSVQIRPPDAKFFCSANTANPPEAESGSHERVPDLLNKAMREETVNAVRFNMLLRHEVDVRLTFKVGEGPRPDIVRWFLVREEVQNTANGPSLIGANPAWPRP